jgi:dTDP-4-amino-4,6-dideoxy-D-glucose acyltransferase
MRRTALASEHTLPVGLNSDFLPRDVLERLGFARVGDDVLIHNTVVVVDCGKVSLGSRVRIDPFVVISMTGGVAFGDNIHVGGHSVMAGGGALEIGDFVNISHYVGIYTSTMDTSGRTLTNPTVHGFSAARTASISFGRHSGVGAGSTVLPGARFAEGSILGAMSLVGRPLKPWTVYAGVPARRIRERRRDVLAQEQDYRAGLLQSE